MPNTASDILAVIAIALVLTGLNEANPHRYLCLGVAAILAAASYKLNR